MNVHRLRRGAKRTLLYVVVITIALIYLLPMFWMVRSSLMSAGEIFIVPPIWIPNPPRFANYSKALTTIPFGRYFLNTIKSCFSMSLAQCCPVPSAPTVSLGCAGGVDFFFALLMSGMMLPGESP